MYFKDRSEAGVLLSQKFEVNKYKDAVVAALPRGGVPVAYQIAKYLKVPLSIIVARKIGSPHQPEYGLGAISEAQTIILDKDRMEKANVSKDDLHEILKSERKELERRVSLYRKGKSLNLKNKVVILVDDGLATGVTARAAAIAAHKLGAKRIIFAVPVCASQSIPTLRKYVDRVVYLIKPVNLVSIGTYYQNFEQVSDQEVSAILGHGYA